MSSFINLDKNDQFSVLRGIDLQDLLNQVDKYLLKYRDTLSLPQHITFGVEIEYENASRFITDAYIKTKYPSWQSKSDASVRSGGEIISPIMTDKKEYWEQLKKICDHLSRRRVSTSGNAGGHIHIGTNLLGEDVKAWTTFLKLYVAYENVIFRFIYGDKINGRKNIGRYAKPIADTIYESLMGTKNIKNLMDLYMIMPFYDRYQAVNFTNIYFHDYKVHKNTLEFRGPNATTSPIVWQNNINAFTKMLKSSKDNVIDVDFLDYKLNHEYISYSNNEYLYECINLKNVLEFVDLIFDNNLDKICFLRQYLKNFQEVYGASEIVNAKKFIR